MKDLESVCGVCLASLGEPHDEDCVSARCSVCGQGWYFCRCEGHDPKAAPWTGKNRSLREGGMLWLKPGELQSLHRYAKQHGKNCLSDDCSLLKHDYDGPVNIDVPSLDSTGWVHCVIADTTCDSEPTRLDVPLEHFEKLPYVGAAISGITNGTLGELRVVIGSF